MKYTQLQKRDRISIYNGLVKQLSIKEIAQKIDRHASTVYREIKRNSDGYGYLYPRDAHKQTEKRKARHGSKIDRHPELKAYIMEQVTLGRSPVVIAGCWNKKQSQQKITSETIYHYAYHPANNNLELWKLFPKAKKKRGISRKNYKSGSTILHRISIHQRPDEVQKRKTFGHYEADLMFNQGSQSMNVLALVERKTRKVFLVKHDSKRSEPIITSIKERTKETMISCTFDNGTEFAQHYKLDKPTFFCDPGSPWQKGSVENMNGMLRRYLPFNLDPKLITQKYLDKIALLINTTPRKLLGFKTPLEAFMEHVKKKNLSKLNQSTLSLDYQKFKTVALHI